MAVVKIKKSEIVPILLSIGVYSKDSGQIIGGLLKEEIPLSVKRGLQRIQKKLQEEYKNILEKENQILDLFKDDKEKQAEELKKLANEEIEIDIQKVSFSKIEDVKTTEIYDFELLDRIFD